MLCVTCYPVLYTFNILLEKNSTTAILLMHPLELLQMKEKQFQYNLEKPESVEEPIEESEEEEEDEDDEETESINNDEEQERLDELARKILDDVIDHY